MKVALIHDWLVSMRGGEKCLEVFCELYPEADLYTLVYAPESISGTIRRMNVRTSWLNRLPAVQKHFRYMMPLFPHAIEEFDLRAYDLILSSSHCVAKGVFPHRALHLAYTHSPMRYVWDLHDAYLAGAKGSLINRAGLALFRSYLQRWDVVSNGRVDHFVANSQNIASKIHRFYNRTAQVVYPPVNWDQFYLVDRPDNYFLIVSALVPYKRIDIAIEAFNTLKLPLKIAGDGPLRCVLERHAQSNIEFLGWVEDRALAELYANCQALIFPGEEDFGITPLEAQSSGRPVIGLGKGGLLETVVSVDLESTMDREGKDPTGVLFLQQTAASLIAAVEYFQNHKARFRPQSIREHARKFSRDRFKQEIQQYVTLCLDERRRNN
jgi:glycosyltransferase involved in cell wall biosynthesis